MKTLKRRRREKKTDYGKRLGLLKGNVPRVVFRKSNKYLIAQYIVSSEAQDSVVFGVTSKILLKNRWPEDMRGSLKSLPAAYLTGFYLGRKILEKNLQTPIIDFGVMRIVSKSRAFAFILGLVDSGVKIKHKKETFPEEEKIHGKKLKRDFSVFFKMVKAKINDVEEEK
nr:50S ribosomal protein L18P [uncultured archaeon]